MKDTEKMRGYKNGKIISNLEISPNIYKVILEGDFQGQPGQFFMIRGWNGLDPFLARPISISDLEENQITFLYEVRGRGTHIISELKKGDKLSILGPLGNGFAPDLEGKIALVSGGVGIAPMYYLSKKLKNKADLYAGFRSDVYLMDELEEHTENIHISTEDGSSGDRKSVV